MEEQRQLLRDSNVTPTDIVISEGLGDANKVYIKFIKELKQQDITLMDWRYYNDGKAWLSKGEYKWTTPRGANKVKPLFWFSLWEGFFKVSFFFSDKLRTELQELPISQDVKDTITSAKSMGKSMRFFSLVIDVSDEKQLADVYILAQCRKTQV